MIKLNEEEEAQKKLEFCTRAEKYGPQLRAKFKCWCPVRFPICGLTDKYFIIYRGRVAENPRLRLVFVDRMQDGSVGDGWVVARYFHYYNSYYVLEKEVTTEVLNQIGDRQKQLDSSLYESDLFDLQGATDPFAEYSTVADWLAKVK